MSGISPLSIWSQLFAAPGALATARASQLSQARGLQSVNISASAEPSSSKEFTFSFSEKAIKTRSQQIAATQIQTTARL